MTESGAVERGYRRSAALLAEHGRTYHLAARLLPAANRRGISALYGYARLVDDIVDHADDAPDATATHLDAVLRTFDAAVGRAPRTSEITVTPTEFDVVAAVADTVDRWRIPTEYFAAFGRSMRMDVPGTDRFVNRYRTFEQLRTYTYGSASVIGLQMLPLLGVPDVGPATTGTATATAAAALGEAFQLTNFIRDVGEDLDRDRIYLPTEELAAFGVDEDHLRQCRADRRTSAPLRRALAHLVAVNRALYRQADPGIALLPNRIRPAIAAAARSYEEILTVVSSSGYDAIAARAVVPRRRRLAHAALAVVSRR